MTRLGLFITGALCLSLAAACGGSAEGAPEAVASETTGSEVVAEAPPPEPIGPPLSYLSDEDTIVMRLDMARVRGSSVADDIASLVRAYPAWEALLGRSGIEPVRDFDRVLMAARGGFGAGGLMFIRHNLTEAQIREAVVTMAAERGQPAEWREHDGFSVVDWPANTDPPRVVVLASPNELVVTTPEEVERVLAVAADHRSRRDGEASVEPGLGWADELVVGVSASELSPAWGRRLRHPPRSFDLVVREVRAEASSAQPAEPSRIHLRVGAEYDEADEAEAARTLLRGMISEYSDHVMVRAVGLDRVLTATVVGGEATELEVEASLTEEEIERVLGLVALLQLSGS